MPRACPHFKSPRAAFTLIELLIVVAIIAILAAIAVPNFLEAQVRSKVSRVKSELRTMRVGVEAYAVDYNKPPNHSWGTPAVPYNGGVADTYNGEAIFGNLTYRITTPISYLSRFDFFDPFVDAKKAIETDWRLYTYERFRGFEELANSSVPMGRGGAPGPTRPQAINMRKALGEYAMVSIGPSGDISVPWPETVSQPPDLKWAWTQYDPTNGTVSFGLIYVSQKYTDCVQRPFPPPF